MRRATDQCQRGVTLIEMIVAIMVTGILVTMASMFGRWQIQAYLDISSRAGLADAGDTALRRIKRELQSALPNSVRVSGNFLEFVPIQAGGRYRNEIGSTGGNPLDFSATVLPLDTSFDVLGPTVNISAGDSVVIYNLGQTGADVYAGTSRKAVTANGNGLSVVNFAPAGSPFPFASPSNRFQIVSTPVTFECVPNPANPALGVLRRRWGYAFSAAQPVAFAGGSSAILVDGVAACTFAYAPGVLQRNGIVSIQLTLANAEGTERMSLMHEVEVLNAP